jgi:ABC-type transport system substrate-binding protein
MVWRLQGPGTAQDYLRVPEWDKLMDEARISLNHAKRKANYAAAHKIYLEYLPWIPVIQPIESYGVQRFLDWKPRTTQDFMIQDVKLR